MATRTETKFPKTERYRHVRLLGVGGMGAAYEAEDADTGAHVALKVMLESRPERLLRFKREFRTVSELHHTNLVRLFDLVCEGDEWFMTMELVQGSSLREALRCELPAQGLDTVSTTAASLAQTLDSSDWPVTDPGEVLPHYLRKAAAPVCDPDRLRDAMMQTTAALRFLHQHGIIHRDIKPSNVMLADDGTVKVLDFGVASQLQEQWGDRREGAIVGTLAYLSPEQCQGAAASPASDLYALGCMMFELLTGTLPFQGHPAAMIRARVSEDAPSIDSRTHGVPDDLVALVRDLLARDPSRRPSLSEVRSRLRGGPESSGPGPDAAIRFVGRHRELSTLRSQCDRVAAGTPSWTLISGESGIGKSSLVDRMVSEARARGFVCIQGRCYERERVPFNALDRAMDRLVSTLQSRPRRERRAVEVALTHLRPLFASVEVLGVEDRFGDDDPRKRKQLAFHGFAALLEHMQGRQPILLVLDDLQWADRESVQLLMWLLDRAVGRVGLVLLSRPEGLAPGHNLEALVALARDRGEHVELGPLPAAAVTALVRQVTPAAEGLAAEIAQRSQGSPYLAGQLIAYLATVHRDDTAISEASLPSIQDLLSWQVDQLSRSATEILSVSSVAGGDLAMPELRSLVELPAAQFDMGLGELMSGHFVKAHAGRSGGTGQRIDVYHDRIREGVYGGLGAERRRALHRRMATLFERENEGADNVVEALLYHWDGAGERELGGVLARRAAGVAAEKLAFGRAAELLNRAMEGEPENSEDVHQMAIYLELSGQFRAAVQAYEGARQLTPESDVCRHLHIDAHQGETLLSMGSLSEGKRAIERGMRRLGLPLDRPLPVRLVVLAGLQARLWLRRRGDRAHRLGSPTDLDRATVEFLDGMVRGVAPHFALHAAEASLRLELLAGDVNDASVLQRSAAFRAIVPMFLATPSPGAMRAAAKSLDLAESMAAEHGVLGGDALVSMGRAVLAMPSDLERARALATTAVDRLDELGLAEFHDSSAAATVLWMILWFKGDWDELLERLDAHRPNEAFAELGHSTLLRIKIHAVRGEIEQAERVQRACDRLGERAGMQTLLTVGFPIGHSQTAWARGEYRLAWRVAVEVAAAATKVGALFPRMTWCMVNEVLLEAGVALAREGSLSRSESRRTARVATTMARKGILDYPALGHRCLALVHFAMRRERRAIHHLELALLLSSSANTSPHRRWQCLTAADILGRTTPEMQAERAALAGRHRFVYRR